MIKLYLFLENREKNKKKTMEKNQKFEYINREKGIVTLHYISYEESRNKAIKSLDGIDERLLNDVDFIKSIAKETKDKMLWVKIGRELKKNVDICAISLLREFIDWNQVEPELKKDKRVLCAAAYNFKNQELFYYDYLNEGQHADDIIYNIFLTKFSQVYSETFGDVNKHSTLINPIRRSMQKHFSTVLC